MSYYYILQVGEAGAVAAIGAVTDISTVAGMCGGIALGEAAVALISPRGDGAVARTADVNRYAATDVAIATADITGTTITTAATSTSVATTPDADRVRITATTPWAATIVVVAMVTTCPDVTPARRSTAGGLPFQGVRATPIATSLVLPARPSAFPDVQPLTSTTATSIVHLTTAAL